MDPMGIKSYYFLSHDNPRVIALTNWFAARCGNRPDYFWPCVWRLAPCAASGSIFRGDGPEMIYPRINGDFPYLPSGND